MLQRPSQVRPAKDQASYEREDMNNDSGDKTRREFLQTSVAIPSAAVLGMAAATGLGADEGKTAPDAPPADALPKRPLGKTGMNVTALSFGGGSQFKKNKDGKWEPLLERAVELGVNYFDTHADYGTEERFGKILPKHRRKIYIATKFESRDPDKAMRSFERSLKLLKTDYVDVLLVHDLNSKDDIDAFANGAWKRMQKLKSEKTARFIGFSSMRSASKSKEFIEKLSPDIALVAMNATRYAGFAKLTLKPARQRQVGVLAMKAMRGLVGRDGVKPEDLLAYVLDRKPVASAVVGHYGMEVLESNVKIVKALAQRKQVSLRARRDLEARCAHLAGPHALCWARSDYLDDGESYA